MNRNIVSGLIMVSLVAGLALPGAVHASWGKSEKKHKEGAPAKEVTVQGVVDVQKDKEGKVTGVDLKASDGTVYRCLHHEQTEKLEKENGKTVECKGTTWVEKNGEHRLKVSSFTVQKP